MAQKKVFDLKEVERLAGLHEKQPEIMQALGVPALAPYLKSNEAFRDAYNRGRQKGGFKLYTPRGESNNGNGKVDRNSAMAGLDADAREVLDSIETAGKSGITPEAIGVDREMSVMRVKRSLTMLLDNHLAHQRGDKYVNGPSAKPGAAHATDPPRPSRKAQAGKQKAVNRRQAGNGNNNDQTKDAAKMAALPGAHLASLNGHTSTARALESARVELLYQRVHGEPSPKAPDVIEAVEQELETIATAQFSGSAQNAL